MIHEPQTPLGGAETYRENAGDNFLWWLATAETEIIRDCKVDRNRYRITGLIVLGTWLFATLAWVYFFSTTISNPGVYLPLGFFMGFIILSIDRALIKGINKTNRNKVGPLLLRGLLALTIGLFMAQPAVLYLFDKEVKMQASIDNEGRKMIKRAQLDSLFAGQKLAVERERAGMQQMLDAKYAEVEKARAGFLAETDGSGGSGKVGISSIALAKRAEYQKLETDHGTLKNDLGPKMDSLTAVLAGIEQSKKQQEAQFATLLNDGFLTRIEALQNLVASNDAVAFRYYLIVAILMLIELMPVIVKSLLPGGPYEEMVRLTEESERELARRNIDRVEGLKGYFNEAAIRADQQAIDAFFDLTHQRRVDKMDELSGKWSADKFQSFDGLWRKVKREVLTRQEG
ncbi:MAG TPA: DUF4407 domain-containing protein [Phnomibacter sp.]|nr:DUF4407 domain-containing protein [Phnomibacter sp.]